MQGMDDTTAFVETFSGTHRYILDYLVDEVLLRQPQDIVDFLLQTCVLDRLSGSLCDAVTGRQDSQQKLETLERSNMLLIPLDDQREWYRYHHLFAEMLQSHARKAYPDEIPSLQQRASLWFESAGFRTDAIDYALAAQDFNRAADLIEQSWPVIPLGIQPALWLVWAKALPDDIVSQRPVLSAALGWILLDYGDLEGAEQCLNEVERWLDLITNHDDLSADMVVANEVQFQSLAGTTASARVYLAQGRQDHDATIQHAQQSLMLLAEHDHYWRGGSALFMGLAQWAKGNLNEAYPSIVMSLDSFHRAKNRYFQVVCTAYLGDLSALQGHLKRASEHYEQALTVASLENDQPLTLSAPGWEISRFRIRSGMDGG